MNMIRVVRYAAAVVVGFATLLLGGDRARSRMPVAAAASNTQAAGAAQQQPAQPAQLPTPPPPANAPARRPDVIYVPTSPEVVEAMLKLANVSKNDVVYDLGCGDGRIVVAAARAFGARAIGVDIDPQRIAEANANAKTSGVEGRVKFVLGDLFQQDLHDATVVTLYLLNTLNLKLRPKLWKELKPGTRVVSHAFDMGDWKPEQTQDVGGTTIYLWKIPAHAPSE
jgi:SAM-dependent methyltransferase